MATLHVILGSASKIKVNAVQTAFPDSRVHAYEVPSGVPNQPLSGETEQGAKNRAAGALERYITERKASAKDDSKAGTIDTPYLALGIENGLVQRASGWVDVACIHVITNAKTTHSGSAGSSQQHAFSIWSDDLPIAQSDFDDWQKAAAATVDAKLLPTIGDTLHAAHPESDPKDPHTFLTKGARTRVQFLADAVSKVRAPVATS